MSENDIISWQAPEYDYRPKDVSWKWASLIAAVILIVFAIWQKNPLFIFFIIIALFLINHFAGQFPKVWQFKISEKGISVSLPDKKEREKFYGFEDMESFDIHPAGEEYKELILKLKSKFTPYLKSPRRSTDRTQDCGSCNRGSIPREGIKNDQLTNSSF